MTLEIVKKYVLELCFHDMEESCHCEEACHLLDDKTVEGNQVRHRHPKQKRSRKSLYILSIILTNLMTAIAAFTIGQTWQRHGAQNTSHISHTPQDETSFYADIDRDSRHTVKFSPFSLEPTASPYTSPPSPEVDQAWHDLGVEYFTFVLPESLGTTFSISPDHAIIPGDAPGAHNESGYAVDMEAMHQLHCLNLLRKGQYFNHEYYSAHEHLHGRPSWAFRDPERNIRGHINHCIDALRERIMCAADDDVLPYWWSDEEGMTISDFAVTRQCKNFESVRSFAEKHQLDDWGTAYRLKTPDGAHIVDDIL